MRLYDDGPERSGRSGIPKLPGQKARDEEKDRKKSQMESWLNTVIRRKSRGEQCEKRSSLPPGYPWHQ